ncbi:MAG: hypothetical protein ACKVOD_12305, partial [Flavobacterium sp.]
NMLMDDTSKIETITFFDNVDGDIYPEKDLPENARKLRGFEWRGDERIKNKEDIYPPDEVELDNAIVAASNKNFEKEKISQEIEKNRIEDHLSGDDFYEEIFRKYNNRLVIDKTGGVYLLRNFKFRFPKEANCVNEYKKNHPKYKDEIKINQVIWNWNTMVGKKYDGGYFTGKEPIEEVELPKKENLTYEEIFILFDDRVIIDRNGMELLIRNGKFKFPSDLESLKKLKINNPKYRKEVRINQVLWDWNSMQYGKYDGGLYTGNEKQ